MPVSGRAVSDVITIFVGKYRFNNHRKLVVI